MRLSRIGVATTTVALLLLTGCSATSTGTDDAQSDAPSGGAFPATVETKFGDVTVDEEPQRIVALGWGDAETALALGVQPVGASDWLGFGGEGVGPWAEGLYDDAPEIIETLEPSFEAIAALEPDLILDVKSSGDAERYERLSSIAPTIGVPEGGDSYLTTSDQQVKMISAALGVPEKGEELIATIDDAFAAATAEHPEWEGLTAIAATKTSEGWGAYIEGSERVRFLERLGFVQSPEIAALETNAGGFSVDISTEQLDLLDADLVVAFPIFIETTEITDDPLFQAVPAVADGRSVVIDGDLSAAYSLGSTLATRYAIDTIVPLIADATSSS
jgi:iron complex transport system substrate-binding protein